MSTKSFNSSVVDSAVVLRTFGRYNEGIDLLQFFCSRFSKPPGGLAA